MQAAMRQIQSPEAQAAYWNVTHPQTTNETPIVAQPDGTFRRETRNIPLNTAGEAAKTALEFTPVVGDVMFAGDVADEARQGNYGTAAALAGLAVLPNWAEKPLKKGLRKIGLLKNSADDVVREVNSEPSLYSAYKTVIPRMWNKAVTFDGTSKVSRSFDAFKTLLSPSYTKSLAESPELIEHIPLYDFSNFSPKQMSEFQKVWKTEATKAPYSTQGSLQYAHSPEDISKLPSLFEDARKYQHALNVASRYGHFVGTRYNSMFGSIEDPVLRYIVETSPQYTDLIARQQKTANGATEEFVKDLVQRANNYRRFMRDPHTVEEFAQYKGRGIQERSPQINVESKWRSDFSGEYGQYPAYYQGKPELTGDFSTWWDQRIPNGVNVFEGVHKKLNPSVERNLRIKIPASLDPSSPTLPIEKAFWESYYSTGAPNKFISWPTHQVFTGEYGKTLPNFDISLTMPEDFVWGRGYSHGGNIIKKFKNRNK